MNQDLLKQQVATVAIELAQAWLHPNDILGVGTGSTVNYFIAALREQNFDFLARTHRLGYFKTSELKS